MAALTVSASAKLNLFLAVTGKRTDGFHDLVSVVAQLDHGDTLAVELRETTGGSRFALTCSDPTVPTDDSNLVLRAATAYAKATGWSGGAVFSLEKRIPVGSGLGGGSSDGVAALRALNELIGSPLGLADLTQLAATLGSDCPLFLSDCPVVIRGRGERVEALPAGARARLRGRSVLVFKPAFGVSTPWAYRRLAESAAGPAGAGVFLPAAEAERRLSDWICRNDAPAEVLLFNNLEPPVFAKYLALPSLLDTLRRDYRLEPRMSGSGSACYALLPAEAPLSEITASIRGAWGDSAFIVATRLA